MSLPVSFSSLTTPASGQNRSFSIFGRLFLLAIFALTSLASVQAQTETVLHSFEGTTDGEFPTSGLVGDGQGNLYGGASGDTSFGTGAGTVFKIDSAETFSVLHTFTPDFTGFVVDVSGLTLDTQGNLYGTAFNATPDELLTFQITSAGAFNNLAPTGPSGPSNGPGQIPGVVLDAHHNAYVAAYSTHCPDAGNVTCTIVKITPGGQISTLHTFAGSGSLSFTDILGLTMDSPTFSTPTRFFTNRPNLLNMFPMAVRVDDILQRNQEKWTFAKRRLPQRVLSVGCAPVKGWDVAR